MLQPVEWFDSDGAGAAVSAKAPVRPLCTSLWCSRFSYGCARIRDRKRGGGDKVFVCVFFIVAVKGADCWMLPWWLLCVRNLQGNKLIGTIPTELGRMVGLLNLYVCHKVLLSVG